VFLGERLGASQWIGVVVVFAAIALILWRSSPSVSAEPPVVFGGPLDRSPAITP
jgi:drug/metabolite transporter (DMT)-like permease